MKTKIKITINTTFFTYTDFSFILGLTHFFQKISVHKVNTTSHTSIYMHTPLLSGIAQMKSKLLFTPFFWFGFIILFFLFIIVWLVHSVL